MDRTATERPTQQMYTGQPPRRPGMRHATIVPYGPYRAADGLVNLAVQNEGQWQRLARIVLRHPDLIDDPRFRTNELRVGNRELLEPLIEDILSAEPREEILARLEQADVPYGTLNDLADLIAHPQLAARDRCREVASPAGPIRALEHSLTFDNGEKGQIEPL